MMRAIRRALFWASYHVATLALLACAALAIDEGSSP